MGFFKVVGHLGRNVLFHPLQDLFKPKSRVSKRLAQDIASGVEIDVHFNNDNFVVFSDIHRGGGGNHDRFSNREILKNALNHYYDTHTLVLLGDIEECWGYFKDLNAIKKKYADLLALESGFAEKDKYIRIYGNHDDSWLDAEKVKEFFNGNGKIKAVPSATLRDGDKKILLVHGCQGHNFADIGDRFSRSFINFKFSTGIIKSSLKDFKKRSRKLRKQELKMLKWAKGKGLVLIMGHTHVPYFMSRPTTRCEENLLELYDKSLLMDMKWKDMRKLSKERKLVQKIMRGIEKTHKKIEELKDEVSDTVFNSGNCCKDLDEISGIEITDGVIKQIYWKAGEDSPEVAREMPLSEVFDRV